MSRLPIFGFGMGVIAGVVGFNVLDHWQAWVLIVAPVLLAKWVSLERRT